MDTIIRLASSKRFWTFVGFFIYTGLMATHTEIVAQYPGTAIGVSFILAGLGAYFQATSKPYIPQDVEVTVTQTPSDQ